MVDFTSRAARALLPGLAAALLAGGCGGAAPRGAPAPGWDVTVNGTTYHLGTGTAVVAGGLLKLYFTDQPDTCLAINFVPTQRMAQLLLVIAPPAGGPSMATVVPGGARLTPAPGQAAGTFQVSTAGTVSSSVDLASGSVAWTTHADRSVTLDGLDVALAGSGGRLAAPVVTVPPCPP